MKKYLLILASISVMSVYTACSPANSNDKPLTNTANLTSNENNKALAIFQQWYDSNLKALDELEHTIYTEYTFSNVVPRAIVKKIVEEINSTYGDGFSINSNLSDDLDIYAVTNIINYLKSNLFGFKQNASQTEIEEFVQKYSIENKPKLDKIILKLVHFNTNEKFAFNNRLEYNNCESKAFIHLPLLDRVLGVQGDVQAYVVKQSSNAVDLTGISVYIDKANICVVNCKFEFEYFSQPQTIEGVQTYKLKIYKNAILSHSNKSSSSTYSEFYLDMRTENNMLYMRIRKDSDYFEYAEGELDLNSI